MVLPRGILEQPAEIGTDVIAEGGSGARI